MKPLVLVDGPWGRRLFIAGMVVAVAITLYFRVRYVDNYTLNTGGYDQNVVYGVVRIMNGTALYTDPERPPFAIVQYGPLHMRLMATVAGVAGIEASDVQGVYIVTRAVVLLLNLLAYWVLYRVCHRLGLNASSSFGVAAFFFTGMAVFYYMRPDSTYILFFWLHVLTFLPLVSSARGKATWRIMLPSVLFGVLAVYSKQTGLLIFLLSIAFFLHQRRWNELWRYTVLSLALGIAGLGLLSLEGGLENAYKNIVLGVANDVGFYWLRSLMVTKYFLIGIPITALGLVAAAPGLRRDSEPAQSYVALGTCIGLAWALLTGLKAGMNINYFTEHQVFAAIAVALYAEGSAKTAWRPLAQRAFILLLPALALVRSAMYFSAFEISRYYADSPGTYHAEQQVVNELRDRGLAAEDRIALWHRGYMELFLPEQTLLDQKDIVYKSRTHGQLDQSEFFRMAEDGRLKYVVAPVRVKEVVILGRNFDNYVPYFRTDSFRVAIHPSYAQGLP